MGILENFTSLIGGKEEKKSNQPLTEHVVLGALLSLVAKADGHISEEEAAAKRDILSKRGYPNKDDQDEILLAAKEAIKERLDWQGFTREVNKACEYQERLKLVNDLFAVAWADHELTNQELETIRKISDLLWIDHKDFINAKLVTKP